MFFVVLRVLIILAIIALTIKWFVKEASKIETINELEEEVRLAQYKISKTEKIADSVVEVDKKKLKKAKTKIKKIIEESN